MGMTRYGMAVQLYSEYVGIRPFSRFTKDPAEKRANTAWSITVRLWAQKYMNRAGGLNQAGVERYIIKSEA